MATGKRGWTALSIILLVHVVLYIGLVGEDWLRRGLASERAMNAKFFTAEVSSAAEARGNAWFTESFVNTGVMGLVFGAMIPTQQDRLEPGMQSFGGSLFTWWEGRLRTWWTVLYFAFIRVSHLLLWWPYAAFLLVPWAIDGWVRRRVKQTDFGFASPLQHRMSLYLIQAIIIGYFLAIFLPVALPPIVIPMLLLATGWAIGKVFAEFAKQA